MFTSESYGRIIEATVSTTWRVEKRKTEAEAARRKVNAVADAAGRLAEQYAVWSWLTKSRDMSPAPGSRHSDLKSLRDVRDALTSLAPRQSRCGFLSCRLAAGREA